MNLEEENEEQEMVRRFRTVNCIRRLFSDRITCVKTIINLLACLCNHKSYKVPQTSINYSSHKVHEVVYGIFI